MKIAEIAANNNGDPEEGMAVLTAHSKMSKTPRGLIESSLSLKVFHFPGQKSQCKLFFNAYLTTLYLCTTYSRVHKSSDSFFSKILEKPSIVQKKMIPHRNGLHFSMK